MSDKLILLSEWKKLYEAAIEFNQLKSWEWIEEDALFGIENPVDGEIGYCCIMGRLGEHFALAVYQGTEGLDGYTRLYSGEVDISSYDALHLQKCLMVSFEDREFLATEDRKIIKELDLRFRGKSAWPLFRNYRPGYFPWYLTPDEVRYLAEAVPQAIEVALRYKANPKMLTPPHPDQYLVRVCRRRNNGLTWEDNWREPSPLPEEEFIAPSLNDIRLEKIRRSVEERGRDWELDCFYSHHPIREDKNRPYYPRLLVGADHQSGLVLFSHLVAEDSDYRAEFIDNFLTAVENYNLLPCLIVVKNEELRNLFLRLTRELEIDLILAGRLPVIEHVRSQMEEFGA